MAEKKGRASIMTESLPSVNVFVGSFNYTLFRNRGRVARHSCFNDPNTAVNWEQWRPWVGVKWDSSTSLEEKG